MVAPDLATADATTYGSAMLDSFKIDISHQEMERIIIELELIYKAQPGQWLPTTVRCDGMEMEGSVDVPTSYTYVNTVSLTKCTAFQPKP